MYTVAAEPPGPAPALDREVVGVVVEEEEEEEEEAEDEEEEENLEVLDALRRMSLLPPGLKPTRKLSGLISRCR